MMAARVISPSNLFRRVGTALTIVVAAALASSCAATTYDESIATSTVVTVPYTVPTGSTEELLQDLATAMSGLSGLIGPDSSGRTPSGKNDQIVVIESLWGAVQTDVAAADSEAADALARMVALARTAVDRNRPADADKAARFAGQVIAKFLQSA